MLDLLLSLLVSLNTLFVYLFYKPIERHVHLFLSFSAGVFLGNLFFHLFPEVNKKYFYLVLLSYLAFFLIELFFHFHHHGEKNHKHKLGILNLIADFFHNFLDGIAIVSAFKINTTLGLLVFVSIMIHELPQELGDFSILIYSGFERKKALLLNFLFSLSTFFGAVTTYLINIKEEIILPLIAGSFLYLATSDLVPLIKEKSNNKKILIPLFLGILIMLFLFKILHLFVEN